jgi:hypothetical protein
MYGEEGREVGFAELNADELVAMLERSEIWRDMRLSTRVLCADRAE